MKKLLLSFFVFITIFSVHANEVKVNMETCSTTIKTRSIVQKPTVTIDDVTFQLSLKLTDPTESYTMFVYDEKGFVVYQDNVVTDGTSHQYLLPNLDYGNYSLVIEGERVSYEGEFDI